jgi:hypothetical protein
MLILAILVVAQAMRMLSKLSKLNRRWHLNAPNESLYINFSVSIYVIIYNYIESKDNSCTYETIFSLINLILLSFLNF